jgi:hypothetical protein
MQGLRKILRALAIILFAGVSLWLFIDAVVNGSSEYQAACGIGADARRIRAGIHVVLVTPGIIEPDETKAEMPSDGAISARRCTIGVVCGSRI